MSQRESDIKKIKKLLAEEIKDEEKESKLSLPLIVNIVTGVWVLLVIVGGIYLVFHKPEYKSKVEQTSHNRATVYLDSSDGWFDTGIKFNNSENHSLIWNAVRTPRGSVIFRIGSVIEKRDWHNDETTDGPMSGQYTVQTLTGGKLELKVSEESIPKQVKVDLLIFGGDYEFRQQTQKTQ